MHKSYHSTLRLIRGRVSKSVRLLRNPAYWSPARAGVAASVEHESIPLDPRTRTVLDVGASHGQFALFAAQAFPDSRIICFEPLPEPRSAIAKVLGGRVEVVDSAVGAKTGRATIKISGQDDSSSLLPIGVGQTEEFPGTEMVGTLDVAVTTLDHHFSDDPPLDPCLLKIDVQGFELDVLKGATKTLAKVDEALVECSFKELYEGQPLADEIVDHMFRAGLRLRGIHGVTYSSDGSAVQADFYFSRSA